MIGPSAAPPQAGPLGQPHKRCTMVENYAAGVIVGCITTFMSATGLAMQKKTHQRLEARRAAARKQGRKDPALRSYKQKLWLAGILLMALASLGSLAVFVSLHFQRENWHKSQHWHLLRSCSAHLLMSLPPRSLSTLLACTTQSLLGQAVASSLAALTILWTIPWAVFYLHERFSWVDGVVSIFMIVGAVLAVVFGRRGEVSSSFLSPQQIADIMQRSAVYIFSAIIAVVLFGTLLYIYVVDKRSDRGTAKPLEIRTAAFGLILCSGIFSGFTGLCSKGVVTQLSYAFKFGEYSDVFTWFGFYFLLLGLPTALVLQVSFLNAALKRSDATEVVPVYQAFIVIWGVAFGWIYYREGAGKSGGDTAGFFCGALLIVLGILLLLQKRQRRPVVLTVQEAIDRLMLLHAKGSALRRTRSAPACPRPLKCYSDGEPADASAGAYELHKRKAQAIASLQLPGYGSKVMVMRNNGAEMRLLHLVRAPDDRTVSAEELFARPEDRMAVSEDEDAEGEGEGAGGQQGNTPEQDLRINVAIPVSPSVMTAPTKDRRYRRTMAVAALCSLRPGRPVPLLDRAARGARGEAEGPAEAGEITATGKASLSLEGEAKIVDAEAASVIRVSSTDGAASPSARVLRQAAAAAAGRSRPLPAVETVPALILPPALLCPVAIVRNVSISPSLLAAALRAQENEEDVEDFRDGDGEEEDEPRAAAGDPTG